MDAFNLPNGKKNIELGKFDKQMNVTFNNVFLSKKQAAVAELLLKGFKNREIAEQLNIKEKTVKFHITGIFKMENVKTRSEYLAKKFHQALVTYK